MGVIDEGKLDNILPKYNELKLSGKNLAQQYVSAFNTGMNIYQCINQLQGYIEWVVKAVNDVVVQWNETSVEASKQATTEQFNIEWKKVQTTLETVRNNVSLVKDGTTNYYVLTESKNKNIKKLDYYFKYDMPYTPKAPYYNNSLLVNNLDLDDYTVKRSSLINNICKLKNKSTGELIDYVYLMLDDNVTVTTSKQMIASLKEGAQLVYTTIDLKYFPYFAKLKTDTPVEGQLYVDACISIILEKTSS